MTIGDGILWFTVLLLLSAAIYQISIRRKWKTVRRVFALAVLAVAVVVGAARGWSRLRSRPSPVTELGGVGLGMTPVEVKLLKGPPTGDTTATQERSGGEFRIAWFFPSVPSNEKGTSVLFFGPSADSLKAEIICSNDDYQRLLGLGEHSSEREIITKLGEPSTVSINSEGLAKMMSYSSLKVAYELTKGRVSDLCISSSGAVVYATEYGAGAGEKSRISADGSRDAKNDEGAGGGQPIPARVSGASSRRSASPPPDTTGMFFGEVGGLFFYHRECPQAARIEMSRRVYFQTRDDALEAGREPSGLDGC